MSLVLKEPMLAPNEVVPVEEMTFPMLASFKMDGLRCSIVEGGRPVTRTLKDIPNDYVRVVMLEANLPMGLDGELGVLKNDGTMDFRRSMSEIMSQDGEPEFRYYIFDNWCHDGVFIERYRSLGELELPSWCVIADQEPVSDAEEAKLFYRKALDAGHEGAILRPSDGPYKMGRATVNQGWMLKLKPKRSAEAEVVGIVQKMKNTNARERDARGHAKRSGAKIGKVPVEAVGALVCRWLPSAGMDYKDTFEVGGGWDAPTAAAWWKHSPVGQIATLEFADTGGYDKPRHAQFKGFRHLDDL